MIRVAMEMSKMDMDNIDDDSKISQMSDTSSQRSSVKGQSSDSSRRSSLYDNTSWYDDIDNASPYDKSPMEDMKKTYYKDLNPNFDPGSYYRTHQPQEPSNVRNDQEEKENYDHRYYGQRSQPHDRHQGHRSEPHHHQGHRSQPNGHQQGQRSNGGFSAHYFTSRNGNPASSFGSGHQRPVDQHHQKYFKAPSSSNRNPAAGGGHFDLDEPDDVSLNLNSNRGAPGGSFHMRDVLDSSLNVPKGISVSPSKYGYKKK